MKKVKFAIIGLGNRGFSMLKCNYINFDEVDFVAVCDEYQDRVDQAADFIEEHRGIRPIGTTNYRDMLTMDLDAVYVATAWESHVMISIDFLKAGIAVAMEVGGAYSTDELFELVRTQETTGTPFMFMENCCFDKNELFATAMARAGKFGTIVHCAGCYGHDLREEITHGNIKRHYRLRNYTHRNCENYPTHELGPIAKLLNINRGNRMLSLVSVASKACGLKEYVDEHPELCEKDPTLKGREFKQGDMVTTIIKCANGETITLRLDTTLPRSYSREFTVRGTKGMYEANTRTVFLDGDEEFWDPIQYYEKESNNRAKYEQEFMPDIWLNLTEEQKKAGHGGMDGFLFRAFLDCLMEGKEMPIDVYDAAAWMCISALSEASVANNGMPKEIPDFTNGKWVLREPKDVMNLKK